ncbi:expressed protein, partial [Chlorella variabilis]
RKHLCQVVRTADQHRQPGAPGRLHEVWCCASLADLPNPPATCSAAARTAVPVPAPQDPPAAAGRNPQLPTDRASQHLPGFPAGSHEVPLLRQGPACGARPGHRRAAGCHPFWHHLHGGTDAPPPRGLGAPAGPAGALLHARAAAPHKVAGPHRLPARAAPQADAVRPAAGAAAGAGGCARPAGSRAPAGASCRPRPELRL